MIVACLECWYRAPTGEPKPARGLRGWIIAQVIVLMGILPLIGSAVTRGSDAVPPSGLLGLLTRPGSLIAGWAPSEILWLRLAGLGIFLFLAAAIVISLLAKPMIKVPVFASNLVPFLVLGACAGMAADARALWRAGVIVCMAALAVAAIPLMHYQMTPDRYGETGWMLKQLAQPGDVVGVSNVSVYWGVMRYAVGEHWGRPLEILPLEANAQWNGLFRKLGLELTGKLGPRPTSDQVVSNHVAYIVGEDARRATANAQRVWVVQETATGSMSSSAPGSCAHQAPVPKPLPALNTRTCRFPCESGMTAAQLSRSIRSI